MAGKLTNIGVKEHHGFRERRVIQITNILSIIISIVLIPLVALNIYIGENLNAAILILFSGVYLLNLYWNKVGLYIIPKIVLSYLITINPFIHLLITGRSPEGQFLSYIILPIILVAISCFLFSGKQGRFMYYFNLGYYILWMLFIDLIIYYLSSPKPDIDFISRNYYFYKAPPIAALLILASLISVFISIINKYEEENERVKAQLALHNRELENRVKERTFKLSETYKKIVNLAFMTSHEIRGPLASILGLTKLFKSENSVEDVVEHLDKLHDKSEEMDAVINKMTRELESMPDPNKLN